MTHLSRSTGLLIKTTTSIGFCLFIATLALGQTARKSATQPAEEHPIFSEYRGVQIGWLADDVRKKLGNPADKTDEQDFYVFNEKETAQFYYDKATHKVTAISIDFVSGASGVPTPQQVFGADFEAKPDGSKYKMVRYPKVGFWITYNRTTGDTPLVTITLQKLAAQ
jgi:hypothetical protein